MSHLAQILFLFYIFIFALNQERKTVSVKEYAYDIIYINLKCPDNIIKLLVAVLLKVLIFGHFPLYLIPFAKRLLQPEFNLYFDKFSRPEADEEGGLLTIGKLSWLLSLPSFRLGSVYLPRHGVCKKTKTLI